MNTEQTLFLSLLKDYVNRTMTTNSFEGIDWESIINYAKQHSLLGVCYVQLKRLNALGIHIPEDVLERFHKGFFNDVYVETNQRSFMKDIVEAFQEKGISFIPFKGWIIKQYWPEPELRTMGDVDLLIHTKDRARSDAIMSSLDYRRFIDNHAVWTYYQKDMLVELHDHMFYEHLANDVDYRGYFDHVWEHTHESLDESFHFLYLITHMAKHTINKGMGFRAYMDLVFFCDAARNRLRWDWIRSELEQLRLLQFAETCFAFCHIWFGFKPPIPTKKLDPDFSGFVSDKLFEDGIFGLYNAQNEASSSAKEITYTKAPYMLGALKVTIRRIFPPYEDMQLIPWYAFVDGRPWLMPFAWVYRWIYCLVHKRKQSEELLTEPFVKKTVIEKRQKLIRDWGL